MTVYIYLYTFFLLHKTSNKAAQFRFVKYNMMFCVKKRTDDKILQPKIFGSQNVIVPSHKYYTH